MKGESHSSATGSLPDDDDDDDELIDRRVPTAPAAPAPAAAFPLIAWYEQNQSGDEKIRGICSFEWMLERGFS